jgi:hypothetical protein
MNNRWPLDYFEAPAEKHIDLFDMGEWGIGMQQMYCVFKALWDTFEDK